MSGTCVIRLLDSQRGQLLDSVSGEYEDSFCLESFADLIAAHANTEPKGTKSLIIARVQTWDHKHSNSKFYSYYNAYHLNKILFQTQIYLDKKLIHRLNVLNPLSNTDIIGHVQYFIVNPVPKTVQCLSDPCSEVPSQPIPANPPVHVVEQSPVAAAPASGKKSPVPQLFVSTATSCGGSILVDLPPPSPSVREAEQDGGAASWTLLSPSVSVVTDDDGDNGRRRSSAESAVRPPLRIAIPEGVATAWGLPAVVVEDEGTGDGGAPPTSSGANRRSLSYGNCAALRDAARYEEWITSVANARKPSVGSDCAGVEAYDAVLFATDDDFLESAHIRSIFKKNAVTPDEATLFEMTPVTSEPPQSPDTPRANRGRHHEDYQEDEESTCGWCFPSNEALQKYSTAGRYLARIRCLCFAIAFLVIIVLL